MKIKQKLKVFTKIVSFKIIIPLIILSAFVSLEISSFAEIDEPIRYGDTSVFERVAREDVTSKDFYTNGRPFFTPLVYKIFKKDKEKIFVFQSSVSIFCWFLFALVLALEINFLPVRYLLVSTLCLLSLTIPINQWDAILLSESFSISVTLLAIGLSIILYKRISKGYTGWVDWAYFSIWVVVCFFLTGTRDSNAYTIWLMLFAFMLLVLTGFIYSRLKNQNILEEIKRRRVIFAALVALILLMTFSSWSLEKSVRWQTPLINVMLIRILTNHDAYHAWVNDYHMPDNREFRKRRGRKAWGKYDKKNNIRNMMRKDNSPIEDVYEWIVSRGLSSYKRYLLWDNLNGSLEKAAKAFEREVNSTNEAYGKDIASVNQWTKKLTKKTFFKITSSIELFFFMTIWSLFSVVLHKECRLLSVVVIFVLAVTAVQAFVCFHGDAAEVSRHMMMVGIMFRVAIIIWAATLVLNLKRVIVMLRAGFYNSISKRYLKNR